MRLIDADALWHRTFICEDAADVRKEIETAPTVDAAPVVHGRLGVSYIDEYYGEFADCMICGTDNILPCIYCRNCGAKMDGGGDGEGG